jgi:hypothetical protein
MGERLLNGQFQCCSARGCENGPLLEFQTSHEGSTPVNKTAALMLAATVSVMAIPAAYAYDSDIRSDWRQLQRDRAALRDERRELGGAERWENWALRHARFWQSWRADRLERHEAADVRALQAKVNRDRADLRHDVREW